jgi:two-component system response regulator YesN
MSLRIEKGCISLLKLMVADDEDNIRNGISRFIKWEDYGIGVCCTASDGREALELATKHLPDIIIVDINMPYINGLEFSAQVRKFLPDCAIIILTGYSEFDFAKESIQIGVVDYLLKPVSPTELIAAVIKGRDQINAIIERQDFIRKLKDQIVLAMPIIREKFVYDVLHGNTQDYELERLEYLGISFPSGKFAALRLGIDNFLINFEQKSEQEKYITMFGVKKITDDLFCRQNWGLSILAEDGIVDAMVCLSDHENLSEYLNGLCREIHEELSGNLNATVSIGIGNIYIGLEQLSYSYKEAVNSLKYSYLTDKGEIQSISSLESSMPFLSDYPFEKEIELMNYVKNGSEQALTSADEMLTMAEQLEEQADLLQYSVIIAKQLYISLLRLLKRMQLEILDLSRKYDFLIDPSYKPDDLSVLKANVAGLFSDALNIIHISKSLIYRDAIQKVRSFIEKNYAKDLSLQTIADMVYMNPNYLCTIFKNETGETINNYIIRLRMHKAMELLKNKNCKVYEISDAVGYKNTNYFSIAFKKFTGISPNEYKNA